MAPAVVLSLDRSQHDAMSNLARHYSARERLGPRATICQVQGQGLKTEFYKTAVSTHPAFAQYNADDLWATARSYHNSILNGDSAVDDRGGHCGVSPITPQSSQGAKDLLKHLEVCCDGIFHAANGGMLINVGTHLEPDEKCLSLWKSLQGVVCIHGVVIQTFDQFRKMWEAASPACLSVQADVPVANELGLHPYTYSAESAGQVKGFKVDGLDMFQTKVGGGCKNLVSQDVIHFTIVNVSRLWEVGFNIDEPDKEASGGHSLQSKLYHILHETRYFSETAKRNRSQPPKQLAFRGNPEDRGPSVLAGYGKKAQAQGTNLELQINIGKSYLKAFQHD